MYYDVDRSNTFPIHPEIQISAHLGRKTHTLQRPVETYVSDVICQTWEMVMRVFKRILKYFTSVNLPYILSVKIALLSMGVKSMKLINSLT